MHIGPTHFARINKITTRQTKRVYDVAYNDNVRITTVVLFELYKLNSQYLIIWLLQRFKTLLEVWEELQVALVWFS